MDSLLLFTILARENASPRCLAILSSTCNDAYLAVYWRLLKHKKSIYSIAYRWKHHYKKTKSIYVMKIVNNNMLPILLYDKKYQKYMHKNNIAQITVFVRRILNANVFVDYDDVVDNPLVTVNKILYHTNYELIVLRNKLNIQKLTCDVCEAMFYILGFYYNNRKTPGNLETMIVCFT